MAREHTRYKIGAVERLTGIPASSIRIWERRHAVVTPQRSESGTRYYTSADVERLKVMRELTEAGDSISEIAQLSDDALSRRRREFRARRPGTTPAAHVMLIGPFTQNLLEAVRNDSALQQVTHYRNTGEAASSTQKPDIVTLYTPSLHRDDAARVHALRRELGARAAIVVYRFASSQVLRAMDAPEISLMRAPIQAEDLLMRIRGASETTGTENAGDIEDLLSRPVAPPRFSEDQLARFATMETAVKCECPRHLADLITAMQSFEQYSAECESRSEADQRLHARLYRGSAHCRDVLEQLLQQTLEAEGLSADDA